MATIFETFFFISVTVTLVRSECPFARLDGPGICNNLANPFQGVAMSLFERKLDNAYNDGFSQPRTNGENNSPLPNPRRVSNTVNYLVISEEGRSEDHIHLLAIFGQWLSHDLVYTPVVPALGECKNCETTHEDCMPVRQNQQESEIMFKWRCMPFTRSADGNTGPGERKQINRVTSPLDASSVYGSDIESYKSLREFIGGRMKTQDGGILPQIEPNAEGIGCSPLSTEPCFNAGDDRNGENLGLNAMHVLWVAEHNRIADYFADKTDWNDEQIFLKTRQLVQAMIQHITYGEYLPILLDDATMTKYGLKEETGGSHFTGYDPSCDITPDTEFATAAFRFGHSTVHYSLNYVDKFGKLIRHGMLNNWYNVQVVKNDTTVPKAMLEELLKQNMQRRDSHVNDVDLFTGISMENEAPSGTKYGILGDVGKNMVGEHFEKLKKCDRFFYSGDSSTNKGSFNENQLGEIRKIGLANIICQHLDREVKISSENPFLKAAGFEVYEPCKNFLKMDLNLFLDSSYTGIFQTSESNCIMFKDLTGTRYNDAEGWIHGVPNRSDPSLTPDSLVDHTPAWKEKTIENPLCLLETAGNEDIGAKFL